MAEEMGRIAKMMAHAGLCSRRDAEAWILAGRVWVNGKKLATPAYVVKPDDEILVDGKPMPVRERPRLWLYHKPRGLVTTHKDPQNRPSVFQYLPKDLPRVVSVGRLDLNSEGLLLLTNYGPAARHMELPKTGWQRSYRVRAFGHIPEGMVEKLKEGVTVKGIHYGSIDADIDSINKNNSWWFVRLREGKNREIRKVFDHFGLKVSRLMRVSYGPFDLGELPEGQVKEAGDDMVQLHLGDILPKMKYAPREEPRGESPRPHRPRERGERDKSKREHAPRRPFPGKDAEQKPGRAPFGKEDRYPKKDRPFFKKDDDREGTGRDKKSRRPFRKEDRASFGKEDRYQKKDRPFFDKEDRREERGRKNTRRAPFKKEGEKKFDGDKAKKKFTPRVKGNHAHHRRKDKR